METTTGFKIKKSALLFYALISTPGKYLLEVANNVSENNIHTDENGSRYIVNLKAVASDKSGQVMAAFGDQEEIPVEQTNGLFLTGSIWKREGQETNLPMKGEKVEAAVDFVPDREGNQVLRITNLRVKSAITASKFDFSALGIPAEAEKVSEESLAVAK